MVKNDKGNQFQQLHMSIEIRLVANSKSDRCQKRQVSTVTDKCQAKRQMSTVTDKCQKQQKLQVSVNKNVKSVKCQKLQMSIS